MSENQPARACFTSSTSVQATTDIGLSVELLFLGLAVTSDRIAGWRIVGVTAALGVTVLGFAVLGSVLLTGASPAVLAGAGTTEVVVTANAPA